MCVWGGGVVRGGGTPFLFPLHEPVQRLTHVPLWLCRTSRAQPDSPAATALQDVKGVVAAMTLGFVDGLGRAAVWPVLLSLWNTPPTKGGWESDVLPLADQP